MPDASIAYTVGPLMARSPFGTITPAGATTSTDDGKATVTFATGERVRIKVRGHDDQLKLSVKERIRCDSADPTTNVSTSIPTTTTTAITTMTAITRAADDHGRGGGHDDDSTTTRRPFTAGSALSAVVEPRQGSPAPPRRSRAAARFQ